MTDTRELSKKNEYYLPKETLLTAKHYTMQYKLWQKELREIENTQRAISYDGVKVQTNGCGDPVFLATAKAEELRGKVQKVESTIHLVADDIYFYLLMGVAYGWSFQQLKAKGMPLEKNAYYIRRRRYYWEISKKI